MVGTRGKIDDTQPSLSMKTALLLLLALVSAAAGQSPVLNVNFGSFDNGDMGSMDGYLGAAPDDPSNLFWNDLAVGGISQSPFSFTDLIYSDNSPALGISLSFPGGSNSWNPQGGGLPLFQSHFHPYYQAADGNESEEVLEIGGLNDSLTYSLYLYAAGATNPTTDFIVDELEAILNSSTLGSFVQGDNYVVFPNLIPKDGKITVTYQDHDLPDNGVFNGFQFIQVPEPGVAVLTAVGLLCWLTPVGPWRRRG